MGAYSAKNPVIPANTARPVEVAVNKGSHDILLLYTKMLNIYTLKPSF
jgi:hypothetical protein